MYMNDQYILENFLDKNGNAKAMKLTSKYLDNHLEEKEYLVNRFDSYDCLSEVIYRIKNNIDVKPICPTCGKPVKFINPSKGYQKYCSSKCRANSDIYKSEQKLYYLDKYGVDNPAKSEEVKNKYKQTCLEKYGVDNSYKSEYIKNKIKQSCLEKYGVTNIAKLQSHIDKLSSKEIINKRNETKRKNKTFNTSKPEELTYILLKEKYPDIIRQYKSDVYPFCCDFYIPSLDLYIECNYSWTHGGHPFDVNNLDDINVLLLWESKHTKYYDNAIYTWTVRDIDKRITAFNNKLNYIEVWNINEIYELLK